MIDFIKNDAGSKMSLDTVSSKLPDCHFGIIAFLTSLPFSSFSRIPLRRMFGQDAGVSSMNKRGARV